MDLVSSVEETLRELREELSGEQLEQGLHDLKRVLRRCCGQAENILTVCLELANRQFRDPTSEQWPDTDEQRE